MGAVCYNTSNHDHINNYMRDEKERDAKTVKMLLLGAGSSGKTALFKSLRMYHNDGVIDQDRKKHHIDMIRYNVLDGIATLIKQCNALYNKDTEIEKHTDVIMKNAATKTFDSNEYSETQLNELYQCIDSIWSLPCIQSTYKHNKKNNNFAISDNLEHFLNNLQSIFEINYVPNEKDCSLIPNPVNRGHTTGMIEYEYKRDYSNGKSFWFKIFDVGGQRAERSKWMCYFDKLSFDFHVHPLLYLIMICLFI